MKKIIHHLRKQPEEVRRHILHIVMFVLIIILILLWVVSLGNNLSDSDTQVRMKQDLEPFSTLKDNIVDSYNDASDR